MLTELRWIRNTSGKLTLQQHHRMLCVDASGAFAGTTEWGDWYDVPVHTGPAITERQQGAPLTNQQVDDVAWAIDEAIRKRDIASPSDIREIIIKALTPAVSQES